jgi:hypothetical protein
MQLIKRSEIPVLRNSGVESEQLLFPESSPEANRLLKYRFYTPRLRQFRGTYPLTHAKKIACSAFCEVSIFRESPQKRYFSSLLRLRLHASPYL